MKKLLLLFLAIATLSTCDRSSSYQQEESFALGIKHNSREILEKTNQQLFQSVLALNDSLLVSTLPENRTPLDIVQITKRISQAWATFFIPATQIDNQESANRLARHFRWIADTLLAPRLPADDPRWQPYLEAIQKQPALLAASARRMEESQLRSRAVRDDLELQAQLGINMVLQLVLSYYEAGIDGAKTYSPAPKLERG